ncbi:MAG: redoxin domain-containing protein [Bacteroidales bacterium]|nr:redoxin domain-containing protein [Bacteroidales bacterium]
MNVLCKLKIISPLLFVPFSLFSQGYEIKIAINSPGDSVIMGYYFAKNNMIPEDTCILDKSGKGVFRGKQKLDRGLYFLVINKKKRFDFVMGDEQKFEIKTDTSDLITGATAKGSKENEVFFDFQRTNLRQGLQLHELRQELEAAGKEGNKEKQTEIRSRLQALHKERLAYLRQQIDAHPGMFVTKFLNTLIPIENRLPDYPRDEAGNITDSSYLYRWYRAHFFDDLNIYDPDMLRTPLYEEKVMSFFTKIIPQHPDSICVEADKILEKTLSDPAVFRCVLVLLFNHYTKSQITVHENVWVHLAEKWYIPHASWTMPDYVENLKKEVAKRKPNLIGQHAPPLEMLMALPPAHFKTAALDTAIKFDLHAGVNVKDFRQSLKGKYTAILFWDISCSHCRKTIQDMYAEYEKLKDKGLTVITVMTVPTKESKGKWVDFINEHQMFGWTNAWSPYSAKYRTDYDVAQTPLIFLLDEDETIIGKRLTPEQLHLLIN